MLHGNTQKVWRLAVPMHPVSKWCRISRTLLTFSLLNKAFFEEALEAAFNVVERSWFESRLRAHLSGTMPGDKAWYALRNIIWASGCRIALSKMPGSSFREASDTSWGFFENALSVHTEVLFLRASVMGVQALILMVRNYYTEGSSASRRTLL